MRDSVVHALGRINHTAIMDLMSELVLYIREAIDRKQVGARIFAFARRLENPIQWGSKYQTPKSWKVSSPDKRLFRWL